MELKILVHRTVFATNRPVRVAATRILRMVISWVLSAPIAIRCMILHCATNDAPQRPSKFAMAVEFASMGSAPSALDYQWTRILRIAVPDASWLGPIV